MAKRKTGLGKSISSIFDGLTGPDKDNAVRQPDGAVDAGAFGRTSDSPQSKDAAGNNLETAYSAQDKVVSWSEDNPKSGVKHSTIHQDSNKRISIPPRASKKHAHKKRKTKNIASKRQVSQTRRISSIIIVIVLAFVAIFAWLKVFTGSSATTKTSPKTDVISPAKQDLRPETITINWERPVEYTLSRNPMARGTGKTFTMTSQDVIVTGIVSSEETGFTAVLSDGSIIHKGDEIHGIKVLDIKSKSVEFEKDGRRWTQAIENR
jgi:hypothetical protein